MKKQSKRYSRNYIPYLFLCPGMREQEGVLSLDCSSEGATCLLGSEPSWKKDSWSLEQGKGEESEMQYFSVTSGPEAPGMANRSTWASELSGQGG